MSSVHATAPVDAFDLEALHRALQAKLGPLGGALSLQAISGGQSNPTYFVSYDNCRMVLRKQPAGKLLPSAHAIDREYRVMAALAGSDVPVPRMLMYCEDRSILGTAFYVMERVDGRVFSDCALPGVPAHERRAIYMSMASTLARLHRVDLEATGLRDYGREGHFFARQISRWTRQWELAQQAPCDNVDRLLAWLPANIPQADETTLAHGDFRLGNLMLHPTEPRVVAVLDWELSTLGHPLADLAYCALAWRLGPDEYMGMRGAQGKGIPREDEFLAEYFRVREADAGGAPVGRLAPFHTAFSLFRLAVIFEGIAARAKSGPGQADNLRAATALARVFARRAVEAVD